MYSYVYNKATSIIYPLLYLACVCMYAGICMPGHICGDQRTTFYHLVLSVYLASRQDISLLLPLHWILACKSQHLAFYMSPGINIRSSGMQSKPFLPSESSSPTPTPFRRQFFLCVMLWIEPRALLIIGKLFPGASHQDSDLASSCNVWKHEPEQVIKQTSWRTSSLFDLDGA